ncbi:hypothetical protein LMJ41_13505 [Streptomyces globisporus]|nr:hypothetical protein [Streptomyces globisporus]
MTIPTPKEELRTTRPRAGASRVGSSRSESVDATYRAWLGHTQCCATCRAGVCCPTAVRLGRIWREVRRG